MRQRWPAVVGQCLQQRISIRLIAGGRQVACVVIRNIETIEAAPAPKALKFLSSLSEKIELETRITLELPARASADTLPAASELKAIVELTMFVVLCPLLLPVTRFASETAWIAPESLFVELPLIVLFSMSKFELAMKMAPPSRTLA